MVDDEAPLVDLRGLAALPGILDWRATGAEVLDFPIQIFEILLQGFTPATDNVQEPQVLRLGQIGQHQARRTMSSPGAYRR